MDRMAENEGKGKKEIWGSYYHGVDVWGGGRAECACMRARLGLALFLAVGGHAGAGELTWENFEAAREEFGLGAGDLAWRKVDWKSSVFDGVREAQRTDKPVLLWLYFGDPRGRC